MDFVHVADQVPAAPTARDDLRRRLRALGGRRIGWVDWEPSAFAGRVLAPLRPLLALEGHVLLAGGAVAWLAMRELQLDIPGAAPPSDMDVFVLTPEGAASVAAFLATRHSAENPLTLNLRASGVVDADHAGTDLPWQFIYGRMGCTPDEVIANFDLDYVCAAIREQGGVLQLGTLPGVVHSWTRRETRIVNEKTLWASRLDKALAKGFRFADADSWTVAKLRERHARTRHACAMYRAAVDSHQQTFGPEHASASASASASATASSRPQYVMTATEPGYHATLLGAAYLLGVRQVVTCLKSPLCVYWCRDMRRPLTGAEIQRKLRDLRSAHAGAVLDHFRELMGTAVGPLCFPEVKGHPE